LAAKYQIADLNYFKWSEKFHDASRFTHLVWFLNNQTRLHMKLMTFIKAFKVKLNLGENKKLVMPEKPA